MKISVFLFCQVFLLFLLDDVQAWWPFQGAEVVDPPTEIKDEEGQKSGEFLRNSPVPFEMSVAEQKFLVEAQRYLGDMSALDQCHQVIITRLRKTCHELGEEEVGKLAVALFNCQSKAEGRALYYCSEEMHLRDCTSGMDPDAWNAYHIISNRARSVCYATRHQQFRLKTEYLVNKLALTAGDQVVFLEQLKNGQERLQHVTKGTLTRLMTGHKDLIQEQVRIRSEFGNVNKELTGKMRENMAALNYEKRIIKEAEQQLSSMNNAIASTLAKTTDELKKQDERRKEEHAAVVVDLGEIKSKTMETWGKIDEKTSAIHEHQEESLNHHVNIIENLHKLNDTISFLLRAIGELESRFDLRLSWLADQFGGTGDKITTLTTCFCHFLYFILMTVSVLFLNAPPLSRVVVLVMVPFNAWAEIKLATSMSYITMTVLILAVVAGHYVVEITQRNVLKEEEKNQEKSLRPSQHYVENLGLPAPEPIRPCTPIHCTGSRPFYSSYQATPMPNSNSWSMDFNRSSTPNPTLHQSPSVTFDPVETDNAKRQLDLTSDQHSTLTSTPSKRSLVSSKRCGAQTRFGSSCKRRVNRSVSACDVHR